MAWITVAPAAHGQASTAPAASPATRPTRPAPPAKPVKFSVDKLPFNFTVALPGHPKGDFIAFVGVEMGRNPALVARRVSIRTGGVQKPVVLPVDGIRHISRAIISPGGKYLAITGMGNSSIHVASLDSGKVISDLKAKDWVGFLSDDELLLLEDGTLAVVSTGDGAVRRTVDLPKAIGERLGPGPTSRSGGGLKLAPDGERLLVQGSGTQAMHLAWLSLATGEVLTDLKLPESKNKGTEFVAVSPDGKRLAHYSFGIMDSTLALYDASSGQPLGDAKAIPTPKDMNELSVRGVPGAGAAAELVWVDDTRVRLDRWVIDVNKGAIVQTLGGERDQILATLQLDPRLVLVIGRSNFGASSVQAVTVPMDLPAKSPPPRRP